MNRRNFLNVIAALPFLNVKKKEDDKLTIAARLDKLNPGETIVIKNGLYVEHLKWSPEDIAKTFQVPLHIVAPKGY